QVIRIVLIVSDTSAVELKIDPAVVLATRKYADDLLAAHKQSREHPDASETAKGFTRYASQVEVNETVTANQKADAVVTVKTLWGWVKQASETVLGMLKVASQSQTDDGTADDVAVTPRKLRSGFASLMSQNGYIALPTWMGGLIIQWGRTPDSIENADIVVTLPTTFPREVYSVAFAGDTFQGAVNFNRTLSELVRGSFKYSAMATGLSTKYAGYGCYYIAIGR
uniref:gp53-like domain-containing protein n=1 Tax=Aeromonas caviae TaxID=648 RepID=UPI0025B7163F